MNTAERMQAVGCLIEDLLKEKIISESMALVLLEVNALVEEERFDEAKKVFEQTLLNAVDLEGTEFRIRLVALLNHLIILEVDTWSRKAGSGSLFV